MALSADELGEIRALLEAPEGNAAQQLRQRFPRLSLTQCDAGDVTETPYAVYGTTELHFIDTADHCVTVTADPARATGLILARRKACP